MAAKLINSINFYIYFLYGLKDVKSDSLGVAIAKLSV